jgi:hypothetical protein
MFACVATYTFALVGFFLCLIMLWLLRLSWHKPFIVLFTVQVFNDLISCSGLLMCAYMGKLGKWGDPMLANVSGFFMASSVSMSLLTFEYISKCRFDIVVRKKPILMSRIPVALAKRAAISLCYSLLPLLGAGKHTHTHT